ncbi:sugar phosphate isomerase/epimerase family protein [Sorangium sp. So ce1182]|uniref:sugar phosphate isomerase/epimerase family protein n=1 Tax=Sorangium sp. So ce1182 TaxID=3133334 RepID=UPI003F6049C3
MREAPPLLLAGVGDEASPDLDGQLETLRRLGFRGIELRTLDGIAIADLDPARFAAAARRIAEEGMSVVALASRIGGWARPVCGPFGRDLGELRTLADRAHALGCRFIRVMSYPNQGLDGAGWRHESMRRLAELVELAAELDVILLHENCSGWASQGVEQTLAMLREIESPHLGLLFDVGNARVARQDPVAFLRRVLPHVRHVHVKDVVLGVDGAAQFTWPGEGEARLAECLSMLEAAGYAGAIAIEPHLAHIPHLGITADTGTLRESFVEFGSRFERIARAAWRAGRSR